jgi:hypothetical protein
LIFRISSGAMGRYKTALLPYLKVELQK